MPRFPTNRHKYRAIVTDVDGFKFSSKKEASHYGKLRFLRDSGDVLFFLRQVPFHLPGGVKYVCDFLVFWKDGEVSFEDVKGYETPLYKTKKKIVESLFPVKIKEI